MRIVVSRAILWYATIASWRRLRSAGSSTAGGARSMLVTASASVASDSSTREVSWAAAASCSWRWRVPRRASSFCASCRDGKWRCSTSFSSAPARDSIASATARPTRSAVPATTAGSAIFQRNGSAESRTSVLDRDDLHARRRGFGRHEPDRPRVGADVVDDRVLAALLERWDVAPAEDDLVPVGREGAERLPEHVAGERGADPLVGGLDGDDRLPVPPSRRLLEEVARELRAREARDAV